VVVSRQRGAITLGDLRELSRRCSVQKARWSGGASEHVWFRRSAVTLEIIADRGLLGMSTGELSQLTRALDRLEDALRRLEP
jgi:hypothetical protein